MNIYQTYMLIFITTCFGVTLGLRSILLYRKTKINTGKVFLMIVIAINFIWVSQNYKYLLPISSLEFAPLQTIGFVLSMLGQIVGFIAQLQMKNSWRLGVDKNAQIELVTTGLFKISRNPIYLCMAISGIGFFLIAPNFLSVVCCLLMLFGINEKIKDEEEFLIEKFGEEFTKYQTTVRRWI